VDGVLARGTTAIPAAVSGFQRLVDEHRRPRIPVAFVTNSLNRNSDKAAQLSAMLGVQVTYLPIVVLLFCCPIRTLVMILSPTCNLCLYESRDWFKTKFHGMD